MEWERFLMEDIPIKIIANFSLSKGREVDSWEEFCRQLPYTYLGVWSNSPFPVNFYDLTLFTPEGVPLEWWETVLNYLYFVNRASREQIGVLIEKGIPKVLDNQLSYLIIQRKKRKELDQNFLIAIDGEIIFPSVSKNFHLEFALYKLAELAGRAGIPIQKWSNRFPELRKREEL